MNEAKKFQRLTIDEKLAKISEVEKLKSKLGTVKALAQLKISAPNYYNWLHQLEDKGVLEKPAAFTRQQQPTTKPREDRVEVHFEGSRREVKVLMEIMDLIRSLRKPE